MGEVIAYTSGAGAIETAEYDSFGQLIAHHTALGVMRLTYDTEGRLTEVVNRKDERYRLFYDADGHVIREIFFDGREEQYEWNTRDKVVRVVQADGEEVSYKYSPAAELIQIRSPRGLDHRYEYDVRGLLIAASAPMSRIELAFDEAGRLVAEQQNGLTVENEYDADNFCVARRLFGAEIGFSYDVRGRLSAITDDDGMFQELRWNSLDQPIERSTGAGIVERVTWRRDDLILTQTITASGVVRVERRYDYDANGRVAMLGDSNGGQVRYAYDAIGRLLEVGGSNGYRESYSYDSIGVITRTHRGDREIGSNGRTLRDGKFAYAYDETGMLVVVSQENDDDEHRIFDANGQLRRLTRGDGVVIDYDYDALGRRVARRTGERTTRYVYTGPVLVGEQDTGGVQRQFAGIEWYTLAEWRSGDRRFVVPDQTNTVREVLNAGGKVVWSGRFEAYGRVVREEGEQVDRQRFPGQFSDLQTGLVYNIYRDYDPGLGAYVSPDPLGLGGGSDHYGYPRNPFLLFDPFGLRCPAHAEAAERNMGAYMNGKGYKKISQRGKPLNEPGIDGVYIAKDGIGPPLYVIAEAKSSQSGRLGNPPPSGQQMSDKWINTGTNGVPPPKDRLTRAVGPVEAQNIRNSGSVGKIVYHQPGGQGPSTVTPLTGPGSKPYAPKGKTDTF
jgi:RHS repeat-associated protein